GVEQQALISAEHEAGVQVLRSDRAKIESTDAVFAAKEELLEDRQLARAGKIPDVLGLAAKSDRHARVLSEKRHRFDRRLGELRVAAEPREIRRQHQALARGRKDRLID